MREFKSFYKTVGGNEGGKCKYPTRLDLYGRGCAHDCKYCYAKSLLQFRGLWLPESPAAADPEKVRRKLDTIPPGTVLRLGGMTDCFQPIEKAYGNTCKAIKAMNERRIHYLIVTKSDLVADPEYLDIMDPELAHVQISITATDSAQSASFEKAPSPDRRIKAIEKLCGGGYDVSVRLSPFIPEYIDTQIINGIDCGKILIEFLRVNHWIEKWFPLNYSAYTVKQSGYKHLPLEKKIELVEKLNGFDEVSVCEDVSDHYEYWRKNVNHNPEDCCNLRGQN